MLIYCTRGCGGVVEVPPDIVRKTLETGAPLSAAHDICPPAEATYHCYRLLVTITRQPAGTGGHVTTTDDSDAVTLATVGGRVFGTTLASVFDDLDRKLSEQWEKVRELQHVAERGADTDPGNPG